jgi:hypothetical protein
VPNVARLKTLLEYVENISPDLIEMARYKGACGTTACLMGHAIDAFPDQFGWDYIRGKPYDTVGSEEPFPGQQFFDLTEYEWHLIFNGVIPNDRAIPNLRERIQEWSSAEYLAS